MNKFFLLILGWLIPLVAIAAENPHSGGSLGIGLVATNLLEPVGLLSDFVDTACFVIGGAFLFASLIKYIEHRRSPLMVPISTVIFLIIAGFFLILLPFLPLFTDNGMRYSLWN